MSQILGSMGAGPKTMVSPVSITGNNNQALDITYSVIIAQLNLTTFDSLEPIPAGTDWGYLRLFYSLDNGTTWTQIQELNSTTYTSTLDCTEINVTIPSEDMGSGDTGFLLKYEANYSSTYAGVLTFVVDALSLDQESSLGVSNSGTNALQVYPNPAGDFFSIAGDQSKINEVKIYTLDGKLIKTGTLNAGRFDISQLKPAVYIVKAATSEGEKSFKLIKK